jgi:hypothetical protein
MKKEDKNRHSMSKLYDNLEKATIEDMKREDKKRKSNNEDPDHSLSAIYEKQENDSEDRSLDRLQKLARKLSSKK